jgi:histidinol-phosphate aminotransferase
MFESIAVEGVKGLQPYRPGKPIDAVARELGLNEADIVKLASNENPLGPGDAVRQALAGCVDELSRYPDGGGYALKETLAQHLSVEADQVTLGNGSSDILDFIIRVLVDKGDEVVVSQHAFAIYGLLTTIAGGKVVEVPARDFGHDLDAMAAAITDKTRIVFVTNPNNPTGTWNTRTELEAFLVRVPESVVVLLDEAYFEYVEEADYPDGIELLSRFPNLVVTRTFSKVYGLAALRIGYGVSSLELADLMNRVRPPFNTNALAQAAAIAALNDKRYLADSVAMNKQGMAQLEAGFRQQNLDFIPSVGNFIAFKVPIEADAMQVYQDLLQHGVIVRPVANYAMPEYLRVSIGTGSENAAFLTALEQVLA